MGCDCSGCCVASLSPLTPPSPPSLPAPLLSPRAPGGQAVVAEGAGRVYLLPTLSVQSPATTAPPIAPGFFFYHHIAKTGGTSWSLDIGKLGLLKHCGISHLVGPSSVHTLNTSLLAAASNRRSPRCNLFNREDNLATSVRVFAPKGIEPKLILLLRHPISHVRSLYAHCQGPTGFLRRQKEQQGTFRPIGFAEWLRLFDGSNKSRGGWAVGWPYCYYNPSNYQTHLLAAPAGADPNRDGVFPGGRLRVPAASLAQLRELLQRQAYFVAVTEHYAASLCLLRTKLSGSTWHEACSAQTQSISHIDYGNQAGHTALISEEVLARIETITRIDQLAYAMALERLYTEAQQAGASSLMWRRA